MRLQRISNSNYFLFYLFQITLSIAAYNVLVTEQYNGNSKKFQDYLYKVLAAWTGKHGWYLGTKFTMIVPLTTNIDRVVRMKQLWKNAKTLQQQITVPTRNLQKPFKECLTGLNKRIKKSTKFFDDCDIEISVEVDEELTYFFPLVLKTFLNINDKMFQDETYKSLSKRWFEAVVDHESNVSADFGLWCEEPNCCNKWVKVPSCIEPKLSKNTKFFCRDIGRSCIFLEPENEGNGRMKRQKTQHDYYSDDGDSCVPIVNDEIIFSIENNGSEYPLPFRRLSNGEGGEKETDFFNYCPSCNRRIQSTITINTLRPNQTDQANSLSGLNTHAKNSGCRPYAPYIYTKKDKNSKRTYSQQVAFFVANHIRVSNVEMKLEDANSMKTLLNWTNRFFDTFEKFLKKYKNFKTGDLESIPKDLNDRLLKHHPDISISRLESSDSDSDTINWSKEHIKSLIVKDVKELRPFTIDFYTSMEFREKWVHGRTKSSFVNDINALFSNVQITHTDNSGKIIQKKNNPNVFALVEKRQFWLEDLPDIEDVVRPDPNQEE